VTPNKLSIDTNLVALLHLKHGTIPKSQHTAYYLRTNSTYRYPGKASLASMAQKIPETMFAWRKHKGNPQAVSLITKRRNNDWSNGVNGSGKKCLCLPLLQLASCARCLPLEVSKINAARGKINTLINTSLPIRPFFAHSGEASLVVSGKMDHGDCNRPISVQ
jgi:hypothetical protein